MGNTKEFAANNLEDAIAAAAAALGIPSDDVHYRLIDEGRRGIMGFGARNVRIAVEVPKERPARPPREDLAGQPTAEPGARSRNRRGRGRGRGRDQAAQDGGARRDDAAATADGQPQNSGELLGGSERKARTEGGRGRSRRGKGGSSRGRRPRRERGEGQAQAQGQAQGQGANKSSDQGERGGERKRDGRRRDGRRRGSRRSGRDGRESRAPEMTTPPDDAVVAEFTATLTRMIELLGFDLEFHATAVIGGVRVEFDGEDRERLFEDGSEFPYALQFLLSRMSRRAWPGIGRIQLPGNGRHNQRDEELIEEIREVAGMVARTGQEKKLHPMNPYERRLVHLTVREYDGLRSRSDGDGFLKTVVVSASGEDAGPAADPEAEPEAE